VTASAADDDDVLRGCTPTARPIGQHTNHAGSVERVDVDQALLTVLTTEHFTLQGARSSTISESSARAALYVGAVSSGLVALGFVGSDPSRRDVFRVFAGVVLPSLYVMGVFTFARLVASSLEDLLYGRAINRIRHVYLDIAGVNRRFLLLGARDDPAGVLANMGITRPSRWQLLYTLATMILMLNAVIGGCAVAFFTALTAAAAGVTIGAGVAAAAVSIWLHERYQTGAHRRAASEREILFPTTPPVGAHERES
jgi:hypothetical protein